MRRYRHVYPGFVQLASFMSMNIERHVRAHRELYDNLSKGESRSPLTKDFTTSTSRPRPHAEFYLETVRSCSRSIGCQGHAGMQAGLCAAPSAAPRC